MKVVIVGGVAGGASASARIRRLDEHAQIIMIERSGYVSYVPFLFLGFVFQFIARHLLYTPERYSGGKFRNFPPLLSHVCPAVLSFDGYCKKTN